MVFRQQEFTKSMRVKGDKIEHIMEFEYLVDMR